MRYIDAHAHVSSMPDKEAVLDRATKAGVTVINICTDKDSFEKAEGLSYNVAAIPPHDVHLEGLEEYFALIEANVDKLVAIGETGLDLVNAEGPLELQIAWFKRHIALAEKAQKPLVIHCREAFPPFFEVIDSYKGPLVLHCFTGTEKEADELIKRGFYISFSGIITFKKSEALREVVKKVPLERMMIETDAPWLAPQSKRGKTNEPAFVIEVAETVKAIKGCPVEEQLYTNTATFFRL